MDRKPSERVLVQVVEITDEGPREISFRKTIAENLTDRVGDIRAAITAGSESVARSLEEVVSPDGWRMDTVSAAFGITLAAEAGVILSKASAGATFDVTVTFSRL